VTPVTSHARWLGLSLAVVVADRASKFVVENYTGEDFRQAVVPGVINIVHSRNPGIAFGLFADAQSPWLTPMLVFGSVVVIGLLVWYLTAGHAAGARSCAGLALILGGAAGNLIDRLLYGGVTDFFEVHWRSFHWPAFNLADSAITIGALLVMIELLFGRHPHASEHASEKKA